MPFSAALQLGFLSCCPNSQQPMERPESSQNSAQQLAAGLALAKLAQAWSPRTATATTLLASSADQHLDFAVAPRPAGDSCPLHKSPCPTTPQLGDLQHASTPCASSPRTSASTTRASLAERRGLHQMAVATDSAAAPQPSAQPAPAHPQQAQQQKPKQSHQLGLWSRVKRLLTPSCITPASAATAYACDDEQEEEQQPLSEQVFTSSAIGSTVYRGASMPDLR